ncbi:glycine cleavage system H protein (lipoate-binding) [Levilactobacillus paucivorans]|uniref:Glycine cleavage system H protein (Lipoate-binding) n=1 Tax=Levilactobacillus paucivorans TaxID=616990 RepID=A0A0R2L7J1_9LACO|nr:glycine cleavage system protein H [Levilactobacillus paucivorans]KRN97723.1 glycine cleavage system H protein (lipoate-binding) [Levilactobacillus paucivorans]
MATQTIWQRFTTWWQHRHQTAPELTITDGVWLEQRDQGHYRLGLTSDAREQMGTLSFVDLPILSGDHLEAGDDILEVESDKAVQNFQTPTAGTVVKINENLMADPETINTNDQATNWVLELQAD